MAWRPNRNFLEGELDNRTPGRVTGWMRFARRGKPPLRVVFNLVGDFHEDIRGRIIRLKGGDPSDPKTSVVVSDNLEGFAPVQRGQVGDITAGRSLGIWNQAIADQLMARNELIWNERGISGSERERLRQEFADQYRARIEAHDPFYCYVSYPYIEWYSDRNGRVVLELESSQVEIIEGESPVSGKSATELHRDETKRQTAFHGFLADAANGLAHNEPSDGTENVPSRDA